MDELLARGIKSVPVTILGDQVVIGFNPKELARLFNLSDAVAVADLPTMIEKYETVLTAACRTFRQLPAGRWDWESPERKRTLGQFCFHLSDRPDRALNAYQVGVYANEDRGREVQDVLGDVDFEAVAQNVEDVLRRVKAALSGSTLIGTELIGTELIGTELIGTELIGTELINVDKMLETYMGRKTAGEMMDLALGHSVHHLKQLYAYMAMMGLEPVDPLGPDDLAGIAVPTELF